jgi:PAS domain S-box-containing protein
LTRLEAGNAAQPIQFDDRGAMTSPGLDPEFVGRARILIVDDQLPNVELLERLFAKAGYRHLRSTTDSRIVPLHFTEFQPDLVLLDLHMPNLDGFAVMEQLRSLIPDNVFLPILVLTADIDDGVRRRALAGGAHDFLVKPFDVTEVWLRVANLLRSRFLHLELTEHNSRLEDRILQRTGELEAARAEMVNVLDVASQAFVGMDAAGRITTWNRQAEVTFGWRREEVIGHTMAETIIDQHGDSDVPGLARSLPGGEGTVLNHRFELGAVDRLGRRFPIEMDLWAVEDDGSNVSFHAFVHDISERRAAEDAIRTAHDQALEASALKSQFLTNMSHEIRTPMNGVLGMASLVLGTDLDAVQRRYILALQTCGHDLLAIINQILDFSQVESGKMRLEEIDFDLAATVDSTVSLLAGAAGSKGLDLDVHVAPAVSWVHGDPVRLRQILTNLVANAVKFTDTGAVRIDVTVAGDGSSWTGQPGSCWWVRFEVTDTGIGIKPSARTHLFTRFAQADSSTTRRFGGTGLGLAICREIVDLMGGVIDYHSQPGTGSIFWFEIPLAAAAPDPVLERLPAPLREPTAQSGRTAAPGGRVLVVDDHKINQLVATAMLEQLGYRVDVANGGAEALQAVQSARYDVIFMDCLMPIMDGYEATDSIRRLEGHERHTPIIALTASAMNGDRQRCLTAGMDDYLSKPIRPAALIEALARWRPGGPATATAASATTSDAEPRLSDHSHHEGVGTLEIEIGADVYARLFVVFADSLPKRLAEIKAATKAGDLQAARLVAHNLTGTSASFGAHRIGQLADQIVNLQEGESDKLVALVAQLDELCARVPAPQAQLQQKRAHPISATPHEDVLAQEHRTSKPV